MKTWKSSTWSNCVPLYLVKTGLIKCFYKWPSLLEEILMTMVNRRSFVLGVLGGTATMVSSPLLAMPGFGRKAGKPTQDDVEES
jgi:hypothetical protein